MNRLFAALVCAIAVPSAAATLPQPAQLNAFADAHVTRPLPAVAAAAEGQLSSFDERLGVPTFYWAARHGDDADLKAMGLTPEQAARRHLFTYGALYRTTGAELAESAVLNHVHDIAQGAVIVSFRKEVDGVRVFRDELKVIMDRQLRLVALSGYLPPFAKVGVKGAHDRFLLAPQTALSAALFDLTGASLDGAAFLDTGKVQNGYQHYLLAQTEQTRALSFSQPARVRPVLFTLPNGLEPAFYVELFVSKANEREGRTYSYVLSAADGRLLFRKNLTADASFSYRVWADQDGHPWDGPQGNAYTPHPTGLPDGTQMTLSPQQLITLQNGPISTNDAWLPANATVSTGNNVDAYADIASPDGFSSGDLRAAVTSAATFDRVYDFNVQPDANSTQRQVAVTQLFVNNNFFHDFYYDVGFNEAAGNAQQDNLGRGGMGNDPLLAEAQDYSGTDNANMSTPSDGASPAMQMYIFSGTSTQYVKASTSASNWNAESASFGPTTFDVTASAIVANDGTAPATDACSPINNNVAGKIAVIDRGTCTFAQKVKAAQNAGAVGAIVVNNQGGGAMPMSGTDSTITIPSLSLSQTDGTTLKNAIGAGTVNVRLFRQGALDRDGTLDNAIVAHEWGHYISNRLIGDANGLDNNQGFGMGEGWGDFHSLLMMVRAEDALLAGNQSYGAVYSSAAYVMAGGVDSLYYGIRRVPYSTNFQKNGFTFKHIQDGVALPNVPTNSMLQGIPNSESHNTGEVWATMLWECYAALLADNTRLTFAQAQERMKMYLVGGYKGTPNSPTFTEARDAILAAAYANDPQDFAVLWAAFARRGIGQKAVSPGRYSQNNSPVTEDFGAGNQLTFVKAELVDDVVSCDNDGLLDNGETGTLVVTLRNSGTASLSATTGQVSTNTSGVTFGNSGQLSFGASQPFGLTTASVPVTLNGATGITLLDLNITFTDPNLDPPAPAPVPVSFRANVQEVPMSTTTDDVEAQTTLWTAGLNNNLNTGSPWTRSEIQNAQHVWFGPNPESPADTYLVSPALQVAASGDFVITFKHRYDFESDPQSLYDGGVLELQVDNGAWTDVGALASPTYDGALAPSPSQNPLRGRQAYAGKSAGYPAWVPVTLNLGTTYAGKTVKFRFRIGSDDAAAHVGWEIDDIGFSGITSTPFTQVTAQTGMCGNHKPVATTEPTATVNEGESLTLTGTGTDADGDALTFNWTQVEGPSVSLIPDGQGGVTFTAPEVTADTNVVLSFTVNDGKEDSDPAQVAVTVKNVAHAPVAKLAILGDAKSGARVTLDASGSSDADGDALSYAFLQTAGPTVVLEGSGAVLSFVVPEVTSDTTFSFQVSVSDGSANAIATGDLTVQAAAEPGTKTGTGCGCDAGASLGAFPLWLAALALAALMGRRRIRA